MKEDEQEGTASVSEASADQKTQEPERRPVNPDMTARVSVLVCVLLSVHAVGQRPQRVVLSLQLPVPLLQLSDLFSQKLHLLPHRQHQVTLHQVLHTHTRDVHK